MVDALIAAVRGSLSQPVAPLLPAEGELVRGRARCPTGTATRRCPTTTTAGSRWDEAQRIVLGAYAALLARHWPRSASASSSTPGSTRRSRPGKAPGAFAHPTVPSAHPYLLLNYQGKHPRRDDAGARAGPRRAPGAGRRRRAR